MLLTHNTGPSRQASLLDFNIPGNPRLSESLNVTGQSSPITSQPNQTRQRKSRDQCVIPDEDPARPIDGEVEDEEGGYFDYMGEGEGDEDDGGEDDGDDGGDKIGRA